MYSLTLISHNVKTGPIPVSTSTAKTCPDSCPFKGSGCYAQVGRLAIHWNKITNGSRGDNFDDFCDKISRLKRGQLWRHNQAGDLAGDNLLIDFPMLKQLVAANKGRKGFTYTHKPVLIEDIKSDLSLADKENIVANNREAILYANENGFTINLSGNNINHAKKLQALNIGPVVSAVAENATTNNEYVVCPATNQDNVNCNSCGLCQKQHKKIVAFPVHGPTKRKANNVVENY